MMKLKLKPIIAITVFIILFIVIDLITKNAPYKGCLNRSNKFQETFISGVLLNKLEDEKDHLNKKIIISQNKEELKHNINGDKSKLYDFLIIGDSIYKESGSMKTFVIRNNATYEFIIDFDCKKRK